MQTDWKIDVAIVDSIGDLLHNVMHSMGTDVVMGWSTGCYTGVRVLGSLHQPSPPAILNQGVPGR